MKKAIKSSKIKKRVNIGLEKRIHTQAKVISVLKNITLNEYLESAISKAVEKDMKLIKEVKR